MMKFQHLTLLLALAVVDGQNFRPRNANVKSIKAGDPMAFMPQSPLMRPSKPMQRMPPPGVQTSFQATFDPPQRQNRVPAVGEVNPMMTSQNQMPPWQQHPPFQQQAGNPLAFGQGFGPSQQVPFGNQPPANAALQQRQPPLPQNQQLFQMTQRQPSIERTMMVKVSEQSENVSVGQTPNRQQQQPLNQFHPNHFPLQFQRQQLTPQISQPGIQMPQQQLVRPQTLETPGLSGGLRLVRCDGQTFVTTVAESPFIACCGAQAYNHQRISCVNGRIVKPNEFSSSSSDSSLTTPVETPAPTTQPTTQAPIPMVTAGETSASSHHIPGAEELLNWLLTSSDDNPESANEYMQSLAHYRQLLQMKLQNNGPQSQSNPKIAPQSQVAHQNYQPQQPQQQQQRQQQQQQQQRQQQQQQQQQQQPGFGYQQQGSKVEPNPFQEIQAQSHQQMANRYPQPNQQVPNQRPHQQQQQFSNVEQLQQNRQQHPQMQLQPTQHNSNLQPAESNLYPQPNQQRPFPMSEPMEPGQYQQLQQQQQQQPFMPQNQAPTEQMQQFQQTQEVGQSQLTDFNPYGQQQFPDAYISELQQQQQMFPHPNQQPFQQQQQQQQQQQPNDAKDYQLIQQNNNNQQERVPEDVPKKAVLEPAYPETELTNLETVPSEKLEAKARSHFRLKPLGDENEQQQVRLIGQSPPDWFVAPPPVPTVADSSVTGIYSYKCNGKTWQTKESSDYYVCCGDALLDSRHMACGSEVHQPHFVSFAPTRNKTESSSLPTIPQRRLHRLGAEQQQHHHRYDGVSEGDDDEDEAPPMSLLQPLNMLDDTIPFMAANSKDFTENHAKQTMTARARSANRSNKKNKSQMKKKFGSAMMIKCGKRRNIFYDPTKQFCCGEFVYDTAPGQT